MDGREFVLLGMLSFGSILLFMFTIASIKIHKSIGLERFIYDKQKIMDDIKDDVRAEYNKKKVLEIIRKLRIVSGKILPQNVIDDIKERLIYANLFGKIKPEEFYSLKIVLAFLSFGVVTSLVYMGSGLRNIGFSLIALAVGYILPDRYLNYIIARKKREIDANILLFVDILSVSCEAGLGLQEAVKRVSKSFKSVLGDEFIKTFGEIETGKPYSSALKDLGSRNPSETLKFLTEMLIQAEKYGTPTVKILKDFTKQIREMRRQKSQEMAQKAVVKMMLPMLVFMLGPILFLIISPAVINITSIF